MKKRIGPVLVQETESFVSIQVDPIRWATGVVVLIALGVAGAYMAYLAWTGHLGSSGLAYYAMKFFLPAGGPLIAGYGIAGLARGNRPLVFSRSDRTWRRHGGPIPARGGYACRAFQQGNLYAVIVEDGEGNRVAGAYMFQKPEVASQFHLLLTHYLRTG